MTVEFYLAPFECFSFMLQVNKSAESLREIEGAFVTCEVDC
jgi:hypothetical protein